MMCACARKCLERGACALLQAELRHVFVKCCRDARHPSCCVPSIQMKAAFITPSQNSLKALAESPIYSHIHTCIHTRTKDRNRQTQGDLAWGVSQSGNKSVELCNTGWRRLIGCLKLQVIFRKRAINYRVLLRKMTYEDKASYGFSLSFTNSLFKGMSEDLE